jgi:hypothetical protein
MRSALFPLLKALRLSSDVVKGFVFNEHLRRLNHDSKPERDAFFSRMF